MTAWKTRLNGDYWHAKVVTDLIKSHKENDLTLFANMLQEFTSPVLSSPLDVVQTKPLLAKDFAFAEKVLEEYLEGWLSIKTIKQITIRLRRFFGEATIYQPNPRLPGLYLSGLPEKISKIPWPPPEKNPIQEALEKQQVSAREFCRRHALHYRRFLLYFNARKQLSETYAKDLERDLGVDNLWVKYETFRASAENKLQLILVEPPGIVLSPAAQAWGDEQGNPWALIIRYRLYIGLAKILVARIPVRRCKFCNALFIPTPRSHGQEFCSKKCREKYHYQRRYKHKWTTQ
jgi:predicted nucleic acid-binding Zn ribbon protein